VRVAALYDIHANLPALEAVLDEVRRDAVDRIIIGGDVVPGPMPRESLARLLALDVPVEFIYGNGELAVLAQVGVAPGEATYWGTVSGKPLGGPQQEVLRWNSQQIHPDYHDVIRSWPATLRLNVGRLGNVLFCHATPRSETECFTRLTPEVRLLHLFEGLGADAVVCGHTHMPFDRIVGGIRVVNAGSVGMPFGRPGADWILLDEEVRFRHTEYDFAYAAGRVRQTAYPQAEEFAERSILRPPTEDEMLPLFTGVSFPG
jgi:predicted phosphodiesterase